MAGPVGTQGSGFSISQLLVRLRDTGQSEFVQKAASKRRSLAPAFVIGSAVFCTGQAYADEVPGGDEGASDSQTPLPRGAVRPAGDTFGLKTAYKFAVETPLPPMSKTPKPEGAATIDAIMLSTLPTLDTLTASMSTPSPALPMQHAVDELTDRRATLIGSAEASAAKIAFLPSTTGASKEGAYSRQKPGYAEPEDYIRVKVIQPLDEVPVMHRRSNRPGGLRPPRMLIADAAPPGAMTVVTSQIAGLSIANTDGAAKATALKPFVERVAAPAPAPTSATAYHSDIAEPSTVSRSGRSASANLPCDPVPTLELKSGKQVITTDEAVTFAPDWTEAHLVERAEIAISRASASPSAPPLAVLYVSATREAFWTAGEADAYVCKLRVHGADGRYYDTAEKPLFVVDVSPV